MDIIQVMKALSDETRIRILNLLKNGELCVCEIESVLGINKSNASRHLNRLTVTNLVIPIKKSQWVYYKLNYEFIEKHPFIKQFMEDELVTIQKCNEDNLSLGNHKKGGNCCD